MLPNAHITSYLTRSEAANTIVQHIASEDQKLHETEMAEQKINRPAEEMGVGTIYMNGSFPAPESHSAFIAAAGEKLSHKKCVSEIQYSPVR